MPRNETKSFQRRRAAWFRELKNSELFPRLKKRRRLLKPDLGIKGDGSLEPTRDVKSSKHELPLSQPSVAILSLSKTEALVSSQYSDFVDWGLAAGGQEDPSVPSSQESVALKEEAVVLNENNGSWMTLEERKRKIIYDTPAKCRSQMEKFVSDVRAALKMPLDDHKCWIHPEMCKRRKRSITRNIYITSGLGMKETLNMNYGVVVMILRNELTEEQKAGYIVGGCRWHLSHLCGNWACCNPRCHIFELGSTNQERKKCHARRQRCPHAIKCRYWRTLPREKLVPPRPQISSHKTYSQSSSQFSTDSLHAMNNPASSESLLPGQSAPAVSASEFNLLETVKHAVSTVRPLSQQLS